jgi:hypothetical protein
MKTIVILPNRWLDSGNTKRRIVTVEATDLGSVRLGARSRNRLGVRGWRKERRSLRSYWRRSRREEEHRHRTFPGSDSFAWL